MLSQMQKSLFAKAAEIKTLRMTYTSLIRTQWLLVLSDAHKQHR